MLLRQASWTETHILTPLLVGCSALAGRLAITEPGTPWYWPPVIMAGYFVGTLVFSACITHTRWFVRTGNGREQLTWAGTAVGVLLLAFPFVAGFARILSSAHFRPLEQTALVALTNIAFFAAAFTNTQRAGSIAVWVSFVLLISSLMLGESTAIVPLSAAYGGLSVAWLATRYMRRVSAATSRGAPVRVAVVPVVGLTLLLAGITATSTRLSKGIPNTWGEWAPSSGGSRWANPAALLGIGDGDWVVSGPNAQSTGSVDSEYFLESDQPSMYDVLTEVYGDPIPPEKMLRAIFVDQEKLLSQRGHKAPHIGTAGRQFSLYRKGRSQQNAPAPEDANALLYAEGHTPLHLAMNVYERFDGVNWHEPNEEQVACELETRESDTSWMWLPKRHATEMLGGTRKHQLRFGRLNSERLPIPNLLERIRLGSHQGTSVQEWANDVLRWEHDGILGATQCMPNGTFLEVASRALDRSALFQANDLVGHHVAEDHSVDVPKHLRASARALADGFEHIPRGWKQIDALLSHLRKHFVHDRDRLVPSDCEDPIHHFLHQARGGPAYQFVTTATLALRSLGYPTRVVSGFYVDPKDYVATAGHTPIRADDAHFWIEVRTIHGDWITFDPTPGYLNEWYRPTLLESARRFIVGLADRMVAKPLTSLAGILISILLWWRPLWLQERLLTMWCLWWPLRSSERRLTDTLRLLDIRSRLCGRQRPPASTPLAWYRSVHNPASRDFLQCLYASLYGEPETTGAAEQSDVQQTCRAAVRAMDRDSLQRRFESA